MRKNWSKNEDTILKKIVGELGLNDWTAVANRLKLKYDQIERTGKQCRQRWYNHLDPSVNKKQWNYEEEMLLFESHKQLGNRWKEISLKLKGRTDNNIKNHFYSTLRRSLRRLNKIVGEKNSTMHMREIKPSVLTIILNFIYDHQEETLENGGQFINELKDLPRLIFEFAQFKPVKNNMDHELKEQNIKKINTIFTLIQQFKESYYHQKNDKKKYSKKNESNDIQVNSLTHSQKNQLFSELKFKYEDSIENIHEKIFESHEKSDKMEKQNKLVNSQDRMFSEGEIHGHLNMMQLDQPSPMIYSDEKNPFPELVIIGKHWSPKQSELEPAQLNIDQILEINYE